MKKDYKSIEDLAADLDRAKASGNRKEIGEVVWLIACKATLSTVTRIAHDSGDPTVDVMRRGLIADMIHIRGEAKTEELEHYETDVKIAKNGKIHVKKTENRDYKSQKTAQMKNTRSDGMDLIQTACEYLLERTIRDGMALTDTISVTLKNGTKKERTIYQWTCATVRKQIYQSGKPDSTNTYLYIDALDLDRGEDLADPRADLMLEQIDYDRYTRLPHYMDLCDTTYGTSTARRADVDAQRSIDDTIDKIKLSARENAILRLRLQGKSTQEIADALKVRKQNVTTYQKRIAKKMIAGYDSGIVTGDLAAALEKYLKCM